MIADGTHIINIHVECTIKTDFVIVTADRNPCARVAVRDHAIFGIIGADCHVTGDQGGIGITGNIQARRATENAVAVLNRRHVNIAVKVSLGIVAANLCASAAQANVDIARIVKGVLLARHLKANGVCVAYGGFTGVGDFVALTGSGDPHGAVGDQQVAPLRDVGVIAVDRHARRACAIDVQIAGVDHAGIVAVNFGACCTAGDGLIAFINDQRIVAVNIQPGGAFAAGGGVALVINQCAVAGDFRAGAAVGDGQFTLVADVGVIAGNDGTGGACAADV